MQAPAARKGFSKYMAAMRQILRNKGQHWQRYIDILDCAGLNVKCALICETAYKKKEYCVAVLLDSALS